jgi:hypothetical protein
VFATLICAILVAQATCRDERKSADKSFLPTGADGFVMSVRNPLLRGERLESPSSRDLENAQRCRDLRRASSSESLARKRRIAKSIICRECGTRLQVPDG